MKHKAACGARLFTIGCVFARQIRKFSAKSWESHFKITHASYVTRMVHLQVLPSIEWFVVVLISAAARS